MWKIIIKYNLKKKSVKSAQIKHENRNKKVYSQWHNWQIIHKTLTGIRIFLDIFMYEQYGCDEDVYYHIEL